MDINEALNVIKRDFDENMGEEGYKEEFADVLEAESILIQFACAVLKKPCDIRYNWEHRTERE